MKALSRHKARSGFTLMEILIVFAIVIFVLILLLLNTKTQIHKANDAKRKTDLNKIQKAFEEYHNDRRCYPPADILTNCGGNALTPFIKNVPCDPTTKTPYLYVAGTPSPCSGYRACAKLDNLNDPDIEELGCDPVLGCGWVEGYNYCISMGVPAADLTGGGGIIIGGGGSGGTPTPTPAFFGSYACRKPAAGLTEGVCNNVGNPEQLGCPRGFAESNCQNLCGDSTLWCP